MILSSLSIAIIPILTIIYQERVTIHQEQVANYLLENVITEWIYEDKLLNELTITEQYTTYTVSFEHIDPQKLTACISWLGANERQYERCESGKK